MGHLVLNFRRPIIIAELWRPEVAYVEKIDFLRFLEIFFSKFCSERIPRDTDRRVVFKFREMWLTEIGKIVHTVRARK